MRIIDFFDNGVVSYPDNDAFVDGKDVMSYADAADVTHKIAHAIRANYSVGTKVGILAPNSTEAFLVLLGSFRASCVWLPVNPRKSVDVNIDLLDRFECDILFYHKNYVKEAEAIKAAASGIKEIVRIDTDSGANGDLADWFAGNDDPFPSDEWKMDDTMAIFPTGGTTGKSKGVLLTHRTIYTMFANFYATFNYYDDTAHLVVAPMTHTAGLLGAMHFARGGSNVIMREVVPVEILKNIQEHKITHLFLPPTVLYILLAQPNVKEFDYSSLRHFMVGAAPTSLEKLKEAVGVFGPVMSEAFGQSEAPAAVLAKAPWDYMDAKGNINEARLASAGRPMALNQVAIMDDDGNLLPKGEAGEIVIKSELVTPGYFKNPEETANISKFGWHLTGDVGVMSKDGFVTIVDRKKDMIITGGFNVFPNEIEQILMSHQAVQDCAVIGVPDEKWGEAVKGIILLKPEMQATSEELQALVKEKLGSVKTPKTIDFVPDLPRSPAGKVLKTELRKEFWKDTKRGVN
jgi:acyl-CoA synthetase (AMP-forming)/AMP-acid ligase II